MKRCFDLPLTAIVEHGNWRPRFSAKQAEESVSKPEWGTKRMCQSCGVKFYDLRRSPIVCPSCGATFDPEALLRSRRTRPAAAKEEAVKKPVAEKKKAAEVKDEDEEAFDADLEDVELDDDADTGDDDLEADESVIEDASELGEDDEDLGDVKVKDEDETT